MKLYYINPNDFGAEYFVMADSKLAALEMVKQYILKMATDPTNQVADIYMDDYKWLWEEADTDNLPKKYTIDEYEMGQVVETEIS